MTNIRRLLRQTLTVARRDFLATVATPTFLLFLLSPVFLIGFSIIGQSGASTMVSSSVSSERIVAIASPTDAPVLKEVDKRLRTLLPRDVRAKLSVLSPTADPAAQAHAMFDSHGSDATAVMFGPLDRPTILYGAQGWSDSNYLAGLAEATLQAERSGSTKPLSQPTRTQINRAAPSTSGHNQAAFFTVFGIFFLTLMLSGQSVGTMMEEKSNKVVEVLAAATPLEAVFLGKLIGMFGSALLFLLFWAALISQSALFLPHDFSASFAEVGPAVGLPMYLLLFFVYFAMSYMLLGALFLGVGAQANTPRELQMLSLPVTVVQMAMLFLASKAASAPGSAVAWFAELFPFSSPYAMAARAANSPLLWPHLLGIAYQLMWVAIAVAVGAYAFRRGVLKTGGGKGGLKALFARG